MTKSGSSSLLESSTFDRALETLPGWSGTLQDGIGKSFTFGDFSAAFAFMTRVALLAESKAHHSDWSNSYNKVSIALVTHDAGGITEKDIALARAIEPLLSGD